MITSVVKCIELLDETAPGANPAGAPLGITPVGDLEAPFFISRTVTTHRTDGNRDTRAKADFELEIDEFA
jgi:hypothetical protein